MLHMLYSMAINLVCNVDTDIVVLVAMVSVTLPGKDEIWIEKKTYDILQPIKYVTASLSMYVFTVLGTCYT